MTAIIVTEVGANTCNIYMQEEFGGRELLNNNDNDKNSQDRGQKFWRKL